MRTHQPAPKMIQASKRPRLPLLAAMALAGCSSAQGEPAEPLKLTDTQKSQLTNRTNHSTEFALALYKELATGQGNVFFSPWSITDAMAMTWAATSGKTNEQIAQALYFKQDPAAVHQAVQHLNHQLVAERAGTAGLRLVAANRLWVTDAPQAITVDPKFEGLLSSVYGAPLQVLDFAESDAARRTINQWVAGKTMNMIPELLPPDSLNELTRAVITNAVAFEGKWSNTFDEHATSNRTFRLASGEEIEVPTMAQTGSYAVLVHDDVRMLAMPYAGPTNAEGRATTDTIRMVLMLPGKDKSLADLDAQLTLANLNKWRKDLKHNHVSLRLPKLDLQASADLAEAVLPAMGMKAPFEFSREWPALLGDANQEPIRINGIFHNAALRVDEEGTKAAAATAVVTLGRASAPVRQLEFHVDQPFALAIEDTATGQVLFMGRIIDPR